MCAPYSTQDLIAPVNEGDGLPGFVRTLRRKDLGPGSSLGNNFVPGIGDEVEPRKVNEANVISSQARFSTGADSSFHLPVIDIDVPVRLVPSSTPGHAHLYIDLPMTWGEFAGILGALERAGVVEPGYYKASMDRGMALVRRPEVVKPAPVDPGPYGDEPF